MDKEKHLLLDWATGAVLCGKRVPCSYEATHFAESITCLKCLAVLATSKPAFLDAYYPKKRTET